MAAARISPAANLLRNSRLFAIPAAVALPAVEPSSEPVSHSDSATTPYPTRAALESPWSSLNQGDWGLKRALPIKTTTKSGTPLVRFQRGIDTPEHVVDFESAADHVLTLRKYQELNLRVTLPAPRTKRAALNGPQRTSAFDAQGDHTTEQPIAHHTTQSWLDESPSQRAERMPQHLKESILRTQKERNQDDVQSTQSQPQSQTLVRSEEELRRWRYSGPYLAGLNGLEFDAFLKTITREKKAAFREMIKNDLVERQAAQQRMKALEEGQTDALLQEPFEPTEDDVTSHMRYLRSEPSKFGPLIAKFFDLADGPNPTQMKDPWHYGRHTIAADLYKESGPPRTHPSAGLSYIKLDTSVRNDPATGPRANRAPVAARLLKSRQIEHNRHIPTVGVAGFVVGQPESIGFQDQDQKWQPVENGPKLVVTPTATTISQAGKVEIQTTKMSQWAVDDELPVDPTQKRSTDGAQTRRPFSSQLPNLDSGAPTRWRPAQQPNQDISEELDYLSMLGSKRPKTSSLN